MSMTIDIEKHNIHLLYADKNNHFFKLANNIYPIKSFQNYICISMHIFLFRKNYCFKKIFITMKKRLSSSVLTLIIFFTFFSCRQDISGEDIEIINDINLENLIFSSHEPNEYQLKQINRKYGMFIHFSINTFHNEEWTDGTKPANTYNPTDVDAKQWVETAQKAKMKYIILVAKHHDGFCLWDSKYTKYDVANSGNTTNVVQKVAEECGRHGIGLGLYYSLWDMKQNENVADSTLNELYNRYILAQLNELISIVQKHTPLIELWLDGGWVKPNYCWPLAEIYRDVKERAPQCQIGVNWSIGLPGDPDKHLVLPTEQKEGYPIRYFPSDFRLGDPFLPANPDPKLFTHDGKTYYMPWESTVCISNKWFFNEEDSAYKSIKELAEIYTHATAQDNIFILNTPPNREGRLRDQDVQILLDLCNYLNL